MDTLVDIFYYDFILSKIIEMYHTDEKLQQLIPYLKIATVLSKKFRDDKIPMDKQMYLKEIYIKIVQVIKHCIVTNSKEKFSNKLIDCIKGILLEIPNLEVDQDFIKLRSIAFAIQLNKMSERSNDNLNTNTSNAIGNTSNNAIYNVNANSSFNSNGINESFDIEQNNIFKYIEKCNEKLTDYQRKTFEELKKNLQEEKLIEALKTIKFENPVMRKFANSIKNEIDNEN